MGISVSSELGTDVIDRTFEGGQSVNSTTNNANIDAEVKTTDTNTEVKPTNVDADAEVKNTDTDSNDSDDFDKFCVKVPKTHQSITGKDYESDTEEPIEESTDTVTCNNNDNKFTEISDIYNDLVNKLTSRSEIKNTNISCYFDVFMAISDLNDNINDENAADIFIIKTQLYKFIDNNFHDEDYFYDYRELYRSSLINIIYLFKKYDIKNEVLISIENFAKSTFDNSYDYDPEYQYVLCDNFNELVEIVNEKARNLILNAYEDIISEVSNNSAALNKIDIAIYNYTL